MVIRAFVIRVRIGKVVLRQFQYDGNQDKKFSCDFPDIAVEGLDFIPVLFDNLMPTYVLPCRYIFVNVELMIVRLRSHVNEIDAD